MELRESRGWKRTKKDTEENSKHNEKRDVKGKCEERGKSRKVKQ